MESLRTATLGQLAMRLLRLARAGAGASAPTPEYDTIMLELRRRGIRTFTALERRIAAERH